MKGFVPPVEAAMRSLGHVRQELPRRDASRVAPPQVNVSPSVGLW